MKLLRALSILAASFISGLASIAGAQTIPYLPTGKPEAGINLHTVDGVRLVKGEWRYSDTKIV
ncbi:MAG: hypothetical protein L0Z53_14710, partial [Acidobacteriales bacterium]|nr:hypothetical protein [Terriglobales bacterium]